MDIHLSGCFGIWGSNGNIIRRQLDYDQHKHRNIQYSLSCIPEAPEICSVVISDGVFLLWSFLLPNIIGNANVWWTLKFFNGFNTIVEMLASLSTLTVLNNSDGSYFCTSTSLYSRLLLFFSVVAIVWPFLLILPMTRFAYSVTVNMKQGILYLFRWGNDSFMPNSKLKLFFCLIYVFN